MNSYLNKATSKYLQTWCSISPQYQQKLIQFRMFIITFLNGAYEITLLILSILEQKTDERQLLLYGLLVSQILFIIISLLVSSKFIKNQIQIWLRGLLIIGQLEYCIQILNLRQINSQFHIFLCLLIIFTTKETMKSSVQNFYIVIILIHLDIRTFFINILREYIFTMNLAIIVCRYLTNDKNDCAQKNILDDKNKEVKNKQINNNITQSFLLQQIIDTDVKNPNCSKLAIHSSQQGQNGDIFCLTHHFDQDQSIFDRKINTLTVKSFQEFQNVEAKKKQEAIFTSKIENEILKHIKHGIVMIDSELQIVYCNKSMKKTMSTFKLDVLLERLMNIKLKNNIKITSNKLLRREHTDNGGFKSKFDVNPKYENSIKKMTTSSNEKAFGKKDIYEKNQYHSKLMSPMTTLVHSPTLKTLPKQISINLSNQSSTFNRYNSNSISNQNSYDFESFNTQSNRKKSQKQYDNFTGVSDYHKSHSNTNSQFYPKNKVQPVTDHVINLPTKKFQKNTNQQWSNNKNKQSLYKQTTPSKVTSPFDIQELKLGLKSVSSYHNRAKIFSQNNIDLSNLQLKQSIIPFSVLKIFQNEEVSLSDLVEKLLEQQEKNFQQNFWSFDDLDDRHTHNNDGKKQNLNNEKQGQSGDIIYFIENNDLVINFKLFPNDAQFTSLRIGFYLQKEKNNQYINQKYILIEFNDQNKLQSNINEKEIFEYKNRMLASVSHELRTPLNCSIQMLQMVISKFEGIPQGEVEEEINEKLIKPALKSNQLLLNIINDIVDYGQISTGNFQLVFAPLSLLEIVSECADLIYFQATLKGITIELIFDSNLPEEIHSDANRIRQVLLNLLSNSLKFTDKGQITIRVSLETSEVVKIEVQDTGCGIPDKSLQNFLETFGNYASSNHLNTLGAGLGLSIANNLALGLGGNRRIDVKSQVGVGTKFAFFIMNRQSHKKGCQYKLKDIFNKKLVKWETITKFDQNNNQMQTSKQLLNLIKGMNGQQLVRDNTTSSRSDSIRESKQSSETLPYSGNIAVTNNIHQNLISVKMRPSQHLIEAAHPKSGRSISLIPSYQQNPSLFDQKTRGSPSAYKTIHGMKSLLISELALLSQSFEHDLKLKAGQNNQDKQLNQDNDISRIVESCQIIEESFQKNYQNQENNYYKSQVNYFTQSSNLIQELAPEFVQNNASLSEDQSSNFTQQDQYQQEGDDKDDDNQTLNLETNMSTSILTDKERNFTKSSLGKKIKLDLLIQKNPEQQQGKRGSVFQQQEIQSALKQFNAERDCNCSQILLVDDNDFNLYTLEMRLKMYGFIVDKANSGFIALDKVKEKYTSNSCCNIYSLIFMDIDMPQKDGHETTVDILNYFKQKKQKPSIISACSAYIQESEKTNAFKSGMIHYITKPIDTFQLLQVIYKIFICQI